MITKVEVIVEKVNKHNYFISKGKESIWKWIGDDPDDCSFICQNCNKEEETAYCAVGEHYVSRDTMWEDFADCKNCCSEKEYRDRHIYG